MSQEVLAALAGLNRHYVNKVGGGGGTFSIINLVKLAGALSVDVTALVPGITSN